MLIILLYMGVVFTIVPKFDITVDVIVDVTVDVIVDVPDRCNIREKGKNTFFLYSRYNKIKQCLTTICQ